MLWVEHVSASLVFPYEDYERALQDLAHFACPGTSPSISRVGPFLIFGSYQKKINKKIMGRGKV